jgi:hypothetical protein
MTNPTDGREEDIQFWWEGGFPGAFGADYVAHPIEPRLFAAFCLVLLAMPEDEFERFLELRPTIVCQPALDGASFRYSFPVMPGQKEAVLHVLYFRPDLHKFSEGKLLRLVAHETAHLIFGHRAIGPGDGDVHPEEAADRKAESWGFKGAYSKEHRRRLAREHELAKRELR